MWDGCCFSVSAALCYVLGWGRPHQHQRAARLDAALKCDLEHDASWHVRVHATNVHGPRVRVNYYILSNILNILVND